MFSSYRKIVFNPSLGNGLQTYGGPEQRKDNEQLKEKFHFKAHK